MGGSGFGVLVLCCSFLCPCFRSKKKDTTHTVLAKEPSSMDSASSIEMHSVFEKVPASPLRVPPSPSRFSMSPKLDRIGSVHLTMNQVARATQNFSPSLRLGEGGFGTVYKAHLPDGQVVAIKRAKKEHFDALRSEFRSEVELLAKIDHRNLVKLLGYVDKGNERLIITEYVPNGTLREHLDGGHGSFLDFSQRLEICIDIAHGLTYLHLYAEKQIIHRDVKSSNILLTERLRAKVADFGFARLGDAETDKTHVVTKVRGTVGYLDPEYMRTYQLTPKSDVYSFGVLLIEILTGRRPIESRRSPEEKVTIRWAFGKYNDGDIMDLVDPHMKDAVDIEIFTKMLGLAFQCAAPTRVDRPEMKVVGEQLWVIRMDYLKHGRKG
nr:calmodulin-binding receptor-like cytoplasmic kinase 3 isoform X2 [Erigeron canadensis]